MYKHSFVAGDEVAHIENRLNLNSRIASIAITVRHNLYTTTSTLTTMHLRSKTYMLVMFFVRK